jgi:hypothetical protein
MNEKQDIFDIVKPKTKLFGDKASRITTNEMNLVYGEIKSIFNNRIRRLNITKPLPAKLDHGDIDIVVQNEENVNIQEYIHNLLNDYIIEIVNNGPILHVLFKSNYIQKNVHVDFITASQEEYDPTLMYLAYNDFSGILGVIARKLNYNYGSTGIYKIYKDKYNQNHYILLTRNLYDGLGMLGYGNVLSKYDDIKTIDDVVAFLSASPLFDSGYLTSQDLNRGDRKRMRAGRATAREIKEKLVSLNKKRDITTSDDYYLKTFYSYIWVEYQKEVKKIDDYVHIKPKYNGGWILSKFPNLKPGPVIGDIQKMLKNSYGDDLDKYEENVIFDKIKLHLNM